MIFGARVADVIHTVGPQGENSSKLKDCYSHCFEQMLSLSQKSIVSRLEYWNKYNII